MYHSQLDQNPALLAFCVEAHESFHVSYGSGGIFHESFGGNIRESFYGRYGSFHEK